MTDRTQSQHLAFEEIIDSLLEGDEVRVASLEAHAAGCESCAGELKDARGIIIALASPAEPAPDLWIARAQAGIRRRRAAEPVGALGRLKGKAGVMGLGAGFGVTLVLAATFGGDPVNAVWAVSVLVGSSVAAAVLEERIALD